MRRASMQIGLGIALGIGIGAAVAVVLGTGGMWLAVGIAVGVIVGKAMSRPKHMNEIAQPKSRFLTPMNRGSE